MSSWSKVTPSAVLHSLVAASKFSGRTQYTTWLIRLGRGFIGTSSSLRRDMRAQLVLQHLADLIARKRVQSNPLLGDLLNHEPRRSQVRGQLFDWQRQRRVGGDDHGAATLAAHGIGHADDRHLTHGRVLEEQVFELLRADVLALADDDVLQPADYLEIAIAVLTGE